MSTIPMQSDLRPPDLTLTRAHDFDVPVEPRVTARLVVSDDVLIWGATSVAYTDIVAVRYGTRNETTALLQQRRVRRIGMQTAAGALEICLGRADLGSTVEQIQADAYYAVIDRLHSHVEPRLRQAAFKAIHGGNRFAIGKISINRDGIVVPSRTRSRTFTEWRQLPSAHFEHDRVVLAADHNNGTRLIGGVSMLTSNAVLLPELCIEGITRYA